MKPELKLIAIGIVFVIVQSLMISLTDRSIYPDLVLILSLALGLRGDRVWALILAFGFGFSIDVLSSSTGLYALLRGTACALTHFSDRALYLRASTPWTMYVLGYVVVDRLLLGLVTHVLKPEVAPAWLDLFMAIPIAAILTAVVAAPLYPMFERLDAGANYDSGWTTLRAKGRI